MFKTLFNIAHCFGSLLGSSWPVLLDTFEQFDEIMQKRNMGASSALSSAPPDALLPFPQRDNSAPLPAVGPGEGNGMSTPRSPRRTVRGRVLNMFKKGGVEGTSSPFDSPRAPSSLPSLLPPSVLPSSSSLSSAAPDDELSILSTALSSLFEGTQHLPDHSLSQIVAALSELALMSLANAATADLADERVQVVTSTSVAVQLDTPVMASTGPGSTLCIPRVFKWVSVLFQVIICTVLLSGVNLFTTVAHLLLQL